MGGISVATCSRIVRRVSEAIVTLRQEFIIFPETEQDQLKVKEAFYKIARFPNVLGCIDCTHIKIQSPGNLNHNSTQYLSYHPTTKLYLQF